MAATARLKGEEVGRYLELIGLTFEDVKMLTAAEELETLGKLVARQLATVPFESLSLHYSKTRLLSLDLDDLFDKIVVRHRGGYCMELNTFFGAILRSMGYRLYSVGARVYEGQWTGLNHMANIVTIGERRYLVDVGFGSNGPDAPVPLGDQQGPFPDETMQSTARQQMRLRRTTLPIHSDPSQKVWIYSTRPNPSSGWTEGYCFTEAEFFPADFAVMNLSTMTSPRCIFVQNVVVVKRTVDSTGEIDGLIILFKDYFKTVKPDGSKVVEDLKTEEQRIKVLREKFGIELTDGERAAIKGLPSELRYQFGF